MSGLISLSFEVANTTSNPLDPLGAGQSLHLLSNVGAPPKAISEEPCRYRHRFMWLYGTARLSVVPHGAMPVPR